MKKQQDEGVTNTVVVLLLLGGLGYWFYQQNQTKIDTASKWWSIF